MKLSGYKLMWMMVMFDLPTGTPPERKMYGDFRNVLLETDSGCRSIPFTFGFAESANAARNMCAR